MVCVIIERMLHINKQRYLHMISFIIVLCTIDCLFHLISPMKTKVTDFVVLSPVSSMVTSFVPRIPVVHAIPITMPVVPFLLVSPMFIFHALPFNGTPWPTSTTRIRRPTSRLLPFVTISSVSSRFLSHVVTVVFPRSWSFFIVSSSGRAPSSFILRFLFFRTFVAALWVTSANVVGADRQAVTSWSASTSAWRRTSWPAPRAVMYGRSASAISPGNWTAVRKKQTKQNKNKKTRDGKRLVSINPGSSLGIT